MLLCPVALRTTFLHDHRAFDDRGIVIDGVAQSYSRVLTWQSLASLTHLPATVAPIGITTEGLPGGLQIIGPFLEDRTTISLAQTLEEVGIASFMPPPQSAECAESLQMRVIRG